MCLFPGCFNPFVGLGMMMARVPVIVRVAFVVVSVAMLVFMTSEYTALSLQGAFAIVGSFYDIQ